MSPLKEKASSVGLNPYLNDRNLSKRDSFSIVNRVF